MSVMKKRGGAYANFKNEGRIARLCIAVVFLLIVAGVFFIDTSLTRSIKEGMLGAFSYDMEIPEAGQKAQELFSGEKGQSVSGGANVLTSLKKPLKNPTVLKSFEDTGSTVQLQAGQLLSVYAVSAGRVVKAENNLIEIEHEDGLISSYGGCASKYIKAGDEVKAGEMIGLLSVETPVLDFGLKKDGKYVEPAQYIDFTGW